MASTTTIGLLAETGDGLTTEDGTPLAVDPIPGPEIFVDPQASTDAPFVALIDIITDAATDPVVTYYESIHKSSPWGIHPSGHVYWTDGFAPLLEAATMTLAGDGKFQLEYIIRRYPAAFSETENVGLSQIARTAVASTAASGVGAGFTIRASTIATATTASSVNAAGMTAAYVIANTTTASNVTLALTDFDRIQGLTTSSVTVDAGLTAQQSIRVSQRVLSSADAALTAAATLTYRSTVGSTVGAGLTALANVRVATTTSSSVNFASTTLPTVSSIAAMTVNAALTTAAPAALATETWPGSAGSNWPAQWGSSTISTATQQSGYGRLVSTSTGYAGDHVNLSGMATATNTDITGTVVMGGTGIEQYALIGVDGSGTDGIGAYWPNQGYILGLNYAATAASGTITLSESSGGSGTTLATQAKTLAGTTVYNYRLSKFGNQLRARVWTGAEPGAWDITTTLASADAGKVFLGVCNGAAATAVQANYGPLTVTVPTS